MRDDPSIRKRFNEICPIVKLEERDIIQAERDVNVAFKIIGFEPANFKEAFQKAWMSSDAFDLSGFVYDVWRHSHECGY